MDFNSMHMSQEGFCLVEKSSLFDRLMIQFVILSLD